MFYCLGSGEPGPNPITQFLNHDTIKIAGVGAAIGLPIGVIIGHRSDKKEAVDKNQGKIDYFKDFAQKFDTANNLSEKEGLVHALEKTEQQIKADLNERGKIVELEEKLR